MPGIAYRDRTVFVLPHRAALQRSMRLHGVFDGGLPKPL